jgi:4-amino-4-deoxy-L-arabinose transferase-like glycosyltransferase
MPPMLSLADVSLPLIGFLALFQIVHRLDSDWRRAGLETAVIWGVFVTVVVEALSVFHLLTRGGLTICWLLLVVLCGAYLLKARFWIRRPTAARSRISAFYQHLGTSDKALLFGVAFLATLIGVTAILSPPNTGDVLFFHMPRVIMWMSHRSVRFYPTPNYQELIYGAWSEYVMLNLDLLFGSDRFVNLVQWFAYLGSAVSVSLIARSLGARYAGQLLTAAICSTIPVAVLEASGSKDNCVVAFWLATSVYFLLEFRRSATWTNTLGFGCAAALAIFTKGTSYLFIPALVAVGWWISTPQAKRAFLWRLPILVVLLLVINGPLYVRNHRLTGSLIGTGSRDLDEEMSFANQNQSIEGIAANLVRNVAICLSGTDGFNAAVERRASQIIRFMGQSPDDPRSIKMPQVLHLRFQTNPAAAREDMTGAPVHFVLMILAVFLALLGWRQDSDVAWYALGLIGSFLSFCALLRWERWGVRYQIPLLVLNSALIGVIFDRYFRRTAPFVGMALILTALPFALLNELRPLLPLRISRHNPIVRWDDNSILVRGRVHYYFADLRADLEESYLAAAQAVRQGGCRNIALDNSFEDVSYLFLAFLNVNESNPALSYSGVYNLTRSAADPLQSPPCTVVCFACSGVRRKWAQYRSIGGRVSTFGDIAVFSAAGSLPNNTKLPVGDDQASMAAVASQMLQRFDKVREPNKTPELVSVLAAAQGLMQTHRDRAREIRTSVESVGRRVNDASMIMLSTMRLRNEATKGEPLSADERKALLASNECLDNLEAEKVSRLKELGSLESSIETPATSSLKIYNGAIGRISTSF